MRPTVFAMQLNAQPNAWARRLTSRTLTQAFKGVLYPWDKGHRNGQLKVQYLHSVSGGMGGGGGGNKRKGNKGNKRQNWGITRASDLIQGKHKNKNKTNKQNKKDNTGPRSVVVSASDCGSEGFGFESHQSHEGIFIPDCLLPRAGSATGLMGPAGPHSRASTTSVLIKAISVSESCT